MGECHTEHIRVILVNPSNEWDHAVNVNGQPIALVSAPMGGLHTTKAYTFEFTITPLLLHHRKQPKAIALLNGVLQADSSQQQNYSHNCYQPTKTIFCISFKNTHKLPRDFLFT